MDAQCDIPLIGQYLNISHDGGMMMMMMMMMMNDYQQLSSAGKIFSFKNIVEGTGSSEDLSISTYTNTD